MKSSVRRIVLALFFLSGACGLVYEVVWMRMLTLVFGATAVATSTVLASFFAGLALGSYLFGGLADRTRRPLALYGLLEAGVGLTAFVMPVLFAGVTSVYVGLSRHFGFGHELDVLRFGLAFLALLVPATLMGGTLPVVVRAFAGSERRLGRDIGVLYALNTFGAVVGAISAGFFLILFVGLRETSYLAAAVNLIIAGTVLGLSRTPVSPDVDDAVPEPAMANAAEASTADTADAVGAHDTVTARLALWAVGLSGFCALGLEVLWTRSLVFFLDNSTHAFTTMLTAFLLGIALGSAVVARFIDGRRKLLMGLGWIEVLIGVTAVLAIPVLGHSTPVLQRMATASLDALLFWKWTAMRFGMSLTVMLLPTVLMGMTVPVAARIYTRSVAGVGGALGRVYAVNTIGGVLGSLVAGFLLIPLVGLHNGIMLVAGVNVAIGAVLVLWEPGAGVGSRSRAAALGGALVVLVAGAFFLTRGRMNLTSFIENMDADQVLSYREGVGATVKVFKDKNGAKYLSIDGFPVAGTSMGLYDAQKALGNLPLLLTSVPSPRVNFVGFGAGGASWEALQYNPAAVDCVELVPAVLDAAAWFPEVNHNVLSDPRFHAIVGDGRNYALVTDKTYDIISIDATSPKMAGNGSLYTVDFYRLLKARLSADGLVVQWLPIHLLSDAEVRMTVRSFMQVFPHTTLWLSAIRHHAVLVGTQKKLNIDFKALSVKSVMATMAHVWEPLKVTDAYDVLGGFVMGEDGLAAYARGARVNSDDHPYLEFTPAMAYFTAGQYMIENLVEFQRRRESVFPLLTNLGNTEEERAEVARGVERRFESSQHTIAGDVFFYLHQEQRAWAEWDAARAIDPDDKNWANPVWGGVRPSG
ncbi:MAG: fused MFS/spermidine synthase [Gemmatimonadetes bacterium]|nr:fused MFS/spermidine synthase [Gemmatimonadota bacterium]